MKKNVLNKTLSVALSLAVVGSTFVSLGLTAYAKKEEVTIPEPQAVYDFSYDFEELKAANPDFEVVENEAAPELVQDEEMGQVLKLGKAVIDGQKFVQVSGSDSGYLESDNSQYSTINIANPFKGLGKDLYEYEPYEDVAVTTYRNNIQPKWEKGITISYWIKTPAGEDGLGLNSNIVGFTSNRFQMQSDDYAKYLTTVKYDVDYNAYTDEEKALFGEAVVRAGVVPQSDFYFELATSDLYLGKPVYKDPSSERMGRIYWMNKNFEDGYLKMNDGTVKTCTEAGRYSEWCTAPILNDETQEHDPNGSIIRYTWSYSEMWLDASSSFYFENDTDNVNKQLNPNHASSYGTKVGMQHGDSFNINSWKGGYRSLEEANEAGGLCDSPVTAPNEWHQVTCVIQNDWVVYYLDGEKIDMEETYSSFGMTGYAVKTGNYKPWKRLNKGTGSRYGYGTDKHETYWCYYGNYCAPTMMEWIVKDCVNCTIGGGNIAGDGYLMYANTDEVQLKNIVFYDEVLNEDQIEMIYDNPFMYDKSASDEAGLLGDVNLDGIINAADALAVLKHAASLETLEGDSAANADVDSNGIIDASDALGILKYAAGLIKEFTVAS